MAKKRITELATETTLKDGQYVAIDHTTDGTKKLNLGAELTDLKEDLKLKADLPTETIENASIASFTDGAEDVPVKELKVAIEPIQSGSGNPSPTNVRPISGRDSVTVTRTGLNGANSQTYTIPLSSTIYGGTLDVGTGVLTVDRALVTFDGSEDWASSTSQGITFYYLDLQGGSTSANFYGLCSKYPMVNDLRTTDKTCRCYGGKPTYDFSRFGVRDSDYADLASFRVGISGTQFVYELATPTTVQLTPTQVTTLLKDNNIFADSGDVKKLIYRADLGAYIEKLINA